MQDNANDSSSYVDISLFERTIPPFREGLKAKELLESSNDMDRTEKARLRSSVTAGERAYNDVCTSCAWMVNRVVREELRRPRSFHVILDEEDLKQVGFEAVWKMMKNADLSKMRGSAVNYLMQWINTNVRRAALKEESEFGMSSSKISTIRKIAAIRARVEKKIGRKASDQEVYDYIQSGAATIKTMYGRADGSSKNGANRKITLDLIKEQASLDQGTPMKYAITDPVIIDSETSRIDLIDDHYDDILETPTKAFWSAWFASIGVRKDQWDHIAFITGVYDLPPGYKAKKSSRMLKEFYLLVASKYGKINEFARKWSDEHGSGRWDVFKDVDLNNDVSPDSIDENGNPIFKAIVMRKMEES
jgi:hypothetical protein